MGEYHGRRFGQHLSKQQNIIKESEIMTQIKVATTAYSSAGNSGVSTAGENIMGGKPLIRGLSIFVDNDCEVSFNGGEFIKLKGGEGYNFTPPVASIVFDTDGVSYRYGGEKARG